MKDLLKTLEQMGQTQSIHQNSDLSSQLSEAQLIELSRCVQDLACSHHPGDDDED